MHVAFLAARTVPNDCGTWLAVRSMVEALIRHGTLEYDFEINESQADLAESFRQNGRGRFVRNLRGEIPWAVWMDGTHPRFPRLDAMRDWVYQNLLGGWSVTKSRFAQAARKLGADLCHYPFQDLPFQPRQKKLVYTQVVYDFRQEHLPELETSESLQRLRAEYEGHQRASAVCVLGETCKADAVQFARLSPERVFVTRFGPWQVPPPTTLQFQRAVREKFRLPEAFIFYPAPTRVHKNHARLIRALATLKAVGCRVPLVTTGKQQPYFDELSAIIRNLGMESDVVFTDYIDLPTLYALYDMGTAVVLPTLFEGGTGIPLLEAMSKGKPIAAARVCEIPAALGDSGLLFDPYSETEIVAAVQRLWESHSLRGELSVKARQTNLQRSWEQFAKTTEAAFRYANGHPNS